MDDIDEEKSPASAFESETFSKDAQIRVNQPVGSMSISPCGRDVVLASRQGLHIIDLDSPYSPPRHLPHHTPWEVADVQWSPFAARDYWVVSTSNQKALVWNVAMTTPHAAIDHVLHAHTRAITDINFSAHHPDVLATCAVDSFVHCWDLRHPARPAMTFCDWFAGATQVKWNRQDSHIIASSHDRYLRIWDDRKGAHPLRSIEAHETKIYGVDWNRTRPTGIVTCSLDKTVKFWDYSKLEDDPERVIRTPFPVWRARHTPFGWGLLAMPQRGNNDLHLYDRRLEDSVQSDDAVPPVHRYYGHQDQVKEFLWRPRGDIIDGIDNREFQLVSWGSDRQLRLHRVEEKTLREVGYEKGREVRRKLTYTRKNAVYKTFRDEKPKSEYHNQGRPAVGVGSSNEKSISGTLHGALSAGMSKAPIPVARGWGDGGFMTSRIGMQGRSAGKEDEDPIAWMKGVKIGNRDNTSFNRHKSVQGPRSSVLSPGSRASGIWDTAESLGDEITHVGDKFSKVTFDEVNVQNRNVTISMNGPWGAESKLVYLKMDIKFPNAYPEASIPVFKVEKTSSIIDETLAKMSTELRTIAQSYAFRRRGCLEAVVCYLLGERGVEDSTAWLVDDEDSALSGLNGQRGAISSDEEDDDVGNFSGAQSQDLEMSGTDLLGPANANANVPLPKACGAMWADNGRLVCFFPPKEEKTRSLLSTLSLKDNDRLSRGQKIFEGFGRLHAGSPGPKNKIDSIDEGKEAAIEEEEGYSSSNNSLISSSSSSSGSSLSATTHPGRFQRPVTWRESSHQINRGASTDRSQRSSAGTAFTRALPSKPRTVVSIHNLEDELPAKKYLAEEYRVFGDGPEVCAHNARIAAKHGMEELAEVWQFVKMILYNEIPLEVMPQPYCREHVLVVARRAVFQANRKDSALDLAFDEVESAQKPKLTGRVRWGKHPFAGAWFIKALFDHFERLADVQMLAMLSCVFSEPAAKEGVSNTMTQLQQHHMPMSMKSPAFSLDYYPSEEVAWSLRQPIVSTPAALGSSQTPLGTHGSAGSSNGLWGSDPVTLHSTGTTPPFTSKSHPRKTEYLESSTFIESTSPELRTSRRSNSNLASAFATTLSRPFSMNTSSSPPTHHKKRLSPEETMPQNVVTWGTNTIYGTTNAMRENQSSSAATHSLDELDTEEDFSPSENVNIKVSLKNQNFFDDEGCVSVPLLDPKQMLRFKAYREAYAHLLYLWNLPITSCEVLKFNGLTSYFRTSNSPQSSASLISIGKQQAKAAVSGSWRGLDVQGHCTTCGTQLQQTLRGGAIGKCVDCDRSQNKMSCSICFEVIAGLYAPCFNCGHVAHSNCHRAWFGNEGEEECMTGCRCRCIDYTVVEVLDLEAEDEQRMDAAKEFGDEGGDDDDWEDDPWDHVGVTSLGRGIGGGLSRGLSPKLFRNKSSKRYSGGFRRDKII
ncbi:MAG: hypothetical protein M1827_001178 [Pycnora praestabilis]|nr:MAG: hypothetical protein M1827_001178 [Pycnora praestabilis]